MKKSVLILVFILFFAFPFVIAGISLSEPEEIYNLGDRIYVSVAGLIGSDTGNLNINLVCGNKTTNFVKISARSFSKEEEQSYSIPYKILNNEDLEIANLSGIIGGCQIISSMGSQGASTEIFTITDNIIVSAVLDKPSYDPGESLSLIIDAVKDNGDLLNGFIEVKNATFFDKAIESGQVTEVFSMPENIEPGSYYLDIEAYDLGENGKLNRGTTIIYFEINQIPTSIVLSLSGLEVIPGENLTIGAEAFDQSGIEMEGTISLNIISPEGIEEGVNINAGEFYSHDFKLNSTSGTWNIVAEFDGILDQRDFEILKNQKVEFKFEDSVLIIKNIGNSIYNKTISILIGDEKKELKDLDINVGEIRKFNLKAPQGEYNVLVEDGETSNESNIFLTGSVISIKNIREGEIFNGPVILWTLLLIFLSGIGSWLFLGFGKTKTIDKDSSNGFMTKMKNLFPRYPKKNYPKNYKDNQKENHKISSKLKESLSNKLSKSTKNEKIVDLTEKKRGHAEHSLVLKGEKNRSTIIAINVKNINSLKKNTKENLEKIVHDAGNLKGLVDWREDYIFLVFSPIITKTYDNEILASKMGLSILKEIKDYNRKFEDKIEFNIGIHTGDLIASETDGKLKYTSIGNTISLSKRIADSNSGKLLVSDDVRKKLIRDLKVIKAGEINNNPIYEISEIKNREANEAKLKDLLKRM
tara:strand:+ start:4315 stop:6408 length:2094 start_codon:yes stop_codon:yes gene_type:complete